MLLYRKRTIKMDIKKYNKTTVFLVLTFVISYSVAGIFYFSGGSGAGTVEFTILGAFYMFIPAISVLITEKVIHKNAIKNDLLISFKINKWFFVAWLLMPVIAISTIGINLIFPGISYNPEMTGFLNRLQDVMTPEQIEEMQQAIDNLPVNLFWLTLIQGLIAGVTVNALAAFGEELGWRGFLLKGFKEMSFFKVCIITGFIWGIWHAPLILMGHNYPHHPQIGVLMMVMFCILLTPFFIYITIKSKSVIAASIMHGTLNATAGLSIIAINGGNDLTAGITGIAGFITFFIFLIFLFLYDYYITKDKIFVKKISDFL
jgi:uncharacterized protein